MFILFGFSAIPFTYLLSYLFSDAASGFVRVLILNIVFGKYFYEALLRNLFSFQLFVCLLSLTGVMLVPMSSDFEKDMPGFAFILLFICGCYPHYSLGVSFLNLYMNEDIRNSCDKAFTDASAEFRCKSLPKCCGKFLSSFFISKSTKMA